MLERTIEVLEKILQKEEDDGFYNQKIKRDSGRPPKRKKIT